MKTYITPSAIITGFTLIGIIVQKFVIKYIISGLNRTKFAGNSILFKSIRKFVIFWFFLLGVKTALPFIKFLQAKLQWINFIDKTVEVLFIATATMAAVNIGSHMYKSYTDREKVNIGSTTILVNILKVTVYIVGLLIIFQTLGIKITPLITALGVGGLAVALALQDTLANLFAGLQIIFAGQVRVGDFVRLDTNESGIVTDITWRNSTITTREQNIIVVPNAKLAQAIVTNFYLNKKDIIIRVPVGVSYSSDLEKVEEVTLEVAKETLEETDGGVKDFVPGVFFEKFNDFSIDMKVILKVNDYLLGRKTVHEFVKRLHKRYNREGIVIPFPIRTIDYLNKDKR